MEAYLAGGGGDGVERVLDAVVVVVEVVGKRWEDRKRAGVGLELVEKVLDGVSRRDGGVERVVKAVFELCVGGTAGGTEEQSLGAMVADVFEKAFVDQSATAGAARAVAKLFADELMCGWLECSARGPSLGREERPVVKGAVVESLLGCEPFEVEERVRYGVEGFEDPEVTRGACRILHVIGYGERRVGEAVWEGMMRVVAPDAELAPYLSDAAIAAAIQGVRMFEEMDAPKHVARYVDVGFSKTRMGARMEEALSCVDSGYGRTSSRVFRINVDRVGHVSERYGRGHVALRKLSKRMRRHDSGAATEEEAETEKRRAARLGRVAQGLVHIVRSQASPGLMAEALGALLALIDVVPSTELLSEWWAAFTELHSVLEGYVSSSVHGSGLGRETDPVLRSMLLHGLLKVALLVNGGLSLLGQLIREGLEAGTSMVRASFRYGVIHLLEAKISPVLSPFLGDIAEMAVEDLVSRSEFPRTALEEVSLVCMLIFKYPSEMQALGMVLKALDHMLKVVRLEETPILLRLGVGKALQLLLSGAVISKQVQTATRWEWVRAWSSVRYECGRVALLELSLGLTALYTRARDAEEGEGLDGGGDEDALYERVSVLMTRMRRSGYWMEQRVLAGVLGLLIVDVVHPDRALNFVLGQLLNAHRASRFELERVGGVVRRVLAGLRSVRGEEWVREWVGLASPSFDQVEDGEVAAYLRRVTDTSEASTGASEASGGASGASGGASGASGGAI